MLLFQRALFAAIAQTTLNSIRIFVQRVKVPSWSKRKVFATRCPEPNLMSWDRNVALPYVVAANVDHTGSAASFKHLSHEDD